MSANWLLSFPVDFAVDEQRHTVDAGGQGFAAVLGRGTILSGPEAGWNEDYGDEFNVSMTPEGLPDRP